MSSILNDIEDTIVFGNEYAEAITIAKQKLFPKVFDRAIGIIRHEKEKYVLYRTGLQVRRRSALHRLYVAGCSYSFTKGSVEDGAGFRVQGRGYFFI